ncbi:hypothetical protein L8P30_09955 [Enterobacter asburiae]|uniref:hypothetical protein n=1 Tax=Enterobacter asburiae TaxID=61645 RepID=UPI0020041F2C|nr:hypothetical protein [Enterobacter asburiae]MCK7142574.1 hypothetical protein [Enterobacter asburiae]
MANFFDQFDDSTPKQGGNFFDQFDSAQEAAPAAPQSTQSAQDKESMGYALHHPVEAFSALGNALATGGAKWLLTDHSTGETTAPQGAAKNWYANQMANPETAHNAGVVAKELPRALAYGGVAALTEGAAVPLMEAAGFSSPLLATVVSNAAGSVAGQKAAGDNVTLSQTAQDAVTGVAFHALGGVAKKTATVARDYLPEFLGGKSLTEKAADTVSPEHIEKVLQGGNQEGQDVYRTATSQPSGESMLNPSQVFDPTSRLGRSFIGQEQRDLATGSGSQYAQQLEGQRSGLAIEKAISDADTGSDLQEAAQGITDAFKARSRDLYETSKNSAQDILSGAGVSQLKLPETKAVADQHLAKHAETGVGLTPEAQQTLTNFKKSKIPDISTLDNWKTTLSEKAQKAYRAGDFTSYNALNDVKNSLRNEADKTITAFNPEAGSLYRDADTYHSQMAGDFGKGSPLSKLANTENPVTAENVFLGGDSLAGRFQGINNTIRTTGAIERALNNGNLEDATLLDELKAGLGGAIRDRAYAAATTGEHFSPTKFANKLNQYVHQSHISGEGNINHALSDVLETMRTKETVGSSLADKLGNVAARGIGAGVGLVKGGPIGAATGQYLAGKAANVVPILIDKVANTAGRSRAMIDFVSDPVNAQKVADVLEARGSSLADATPETITSIVKVLKRYGTQATVAANQPDNPLATFNKREVTPTPESQIMNQVNPEPEPEQQAQAAAPEISPVATHLYRALSSAETGGIKNRFIRTNAAESGVSTAYGPAQVVVTTAKDFYQKHPDVFSDEEKAYLDRFIQQGEMMKKAAKNDPVYGYGKAGVMGNSPEDRHMYYQVFGKMLDNMITNNKGDLEKTMKQWRGNDNDQAYFKKVRKSWGRFNEPSQPSISAKKGWSKPATA